ncbi:MAG: hypothetical protein AAGI63_05855 [Planctomycetota bacterium]
MRFSIATFLLMTLCLTGCRQTTGLNSGGPLTPIGPVSATSSTGALTPLGSGQSPSLGPFGGPVRVTPPTTGSYVAPNNYMGGGQVSYPQQFGSGVVQSNPTGNGWNGGWNPPTVGSGVQQTGGYGNGFNQPSNGVGSNSSFAPNTSGIAPPPTANGIRSGGMQAIDLTGAPQPPGYQPPAYQPPAYQPPLGNYAPQNQPALAPAPVPQYNQPPVSNQAPQWRPPQVISAPSQANIATAPSTEPINGGGQNLQWRRPQ